MPHDDAAHRMDHIRALPTPWLENMPAEILVMIASESLGSWHKLQKQEKTTSIRQTMRKCLFSGNARKQALLRFPYLQWISEAQRSDLMKDDKLPWGEEVLLRHFGLSPDIRLELLRPSTRASIQKYASENDDAALLQALAPALRRPRKVLFLEIPWRLEVVSLPLEEVNMPVGSSHMCTWGDQVVLHTYFDHRVVICDPREGANGTLTLVPHTVQRYGNSEPLMMHVHKDTLFTSGSAQGDFHAIDLRTGACEIIPSQLQITTHKDSIACTDEFLWVLDLNKRVEVWKRTPVLRSTHTLPYLGFSKVAAWGHLGFAVFLDDIYVYNGRTKAEETTIRAHATVDHLAVLSEKMLCAANSRGEIEAWSLTDWSRLWTCGLSSPYTCTCLVTRGMGLLLYAGTIQINAEHTHMFAVIDDAGKIVHRKFVPRQIYALANTQTAVFARECDAEGEAGRLRVWRAD